MQIGSHALTDARIQRVENRSARLWVLLVWLLAALITAQGLRSGVAGGVTAADIGAGVERAGIPGSNEAYQAARIGILLVSIYSIAYAAPIRRARSREMRLVWAGFVLSALAVIASVVLGQPGGGSFALLELALVLLAMWALPTPPLAVALRAVRSVLIAIAVLSLTLFALAPEIASQPYSGGIVDALPFRLHGVTAHANILGAALALFFVLELERERASAPVWLARGTVLAALVLTQSKTSIGVAIAVIALMTLFARSQRRPGRAPRVLAAIAVVIVAVQFIASEGQALVQDVSAGSFTGRGLIWATTLDVWAGSPIFGYGPGLWNLDMRVSYLGSLPNPPAHAHSQVFQTLGMFGLFGMVALLVLTAGVLAVARNGSVATRGASVGVLLLLLGRGLTEPVWFAESLSNSAIFLLALVPLISAAESGVRTQSIRALSERPALR